MKDFIKGYSITGVPILDGAKIFDWVDSKGMPLDFINELMEENGFGLDVKGFIQAAKQSKNFQNKDRLRILLVSSMLRQNIDAEKNIDKLIEEIYGA